MTEKLIDESFDWQYDIKSPDIQKLLELNGLLIDILNTSDAGEGVHRYVQVGELYYNIPIEGGLTLILKDSVSSIPIAAGTICVVEGIPVVRMMQKVKAVQRVEGFQTSSRIKLGAEYPEVDHPLKFLQSGSSSKPWKKIFLGLFEDISKQNGFTKLKMISGFRNPHLAALSGHEDRSYPVSAAVANYDQVVFEEQSWKPFLSDGVEIKGEARETLNIYMKKLKNGKLDENQFTKDFLTDELPAYWEKEIG